MKQAVKIGIIGDYDPAKTSHPATEEAIRHAASRLSLRVDVTWIPTPSLLIEENLQGLEQYHALWGGSGSPYRSTEGALKGIRRARELNRPFIAT